MCRGCLKMYADLFSYYKSQLSYVILNYFPDLTLKEWALGGAFAVLLALILLAARSSGKIGLKHIIFSELLYGFIFLVIGSTVLSRTAWQGTHFVPDLLGTYQQILEGVDRAAVIKQNVLNICLLLPAGILFPLCVPIQGRPRGPLASLRSRIPHRRFLAVTLAGFSCSLLIESLQYLTKRGVFELDDLLHNTLGVMIGYLLYRTAVTLCEASRRRPVRIAAAFA